MRVQAVRVVARGSQVQLVSMGGEIVIVCG